MAVFKNAQGRHMAILKIPEIEVCNELEMLGNKSTQSHSHSQSLASRESPAQAESNKHT